MAVLSKTVGPVLSVSVIVILSYFVFKKMYDVFIGANIERLENNKLLNLVHEGLLILSRDDKKEVLFSNCKFKEYLSVGMDLQQYL